MKPWLHEILACPMDKNFPLKLFIFNYETSSNNFETVINVYEKGDLEKIKKENIIQIFKDKDEIYCKDNIIIEKTSLKEYIKKILSSINELANFEDLSKDINSVQCLDLLESKVKQKINSYSNALNPQAFDSILPELYLLNKYKIETEIESGLLFCEKCRRWFPIIETIPQMLPDEYREEKKEIQFLKTIKNLLDEEFFNQDLKPFNI
ncbi:MAG: Trm112 family protein [Promethearchaeota archaeon]